MRHLEHRLRITTSALLLAGLGATAAAQDPPPSAAQDVAVIVHPDNPLRDVKLAQLRGYLRLDRQFWPGRKRVVLFLPSPGSPAKQVLNDLVYKMDEKQLFKHWKGKVFAGDIPALPQVVKTAAQAGKSVAGSKGGAVSAVSADQIPKRVRALKIDGYAPGEEGYPLRGRPETAAVARP